MLKTAISDSSSISWVERKLCDPGIFVSFFKLLYPQYLEIGIFVEWMNRDIKPWKQMRSLRKKVLESSRAQHWAPGDMPTSGVWQKRRKRQSSFLWIPLTLENQSRGHVFLEHLLQSLDHIVSGFLEISVLVASSSLLHEDRTGEDLCTYRPQGWPWGNWGWTGMDGVECMGWGDHAWARRPLFCAVR